MGLFVLQETPVGYALFKAKSSKKLKDGFIAETDSIEDIVGKLKLKDFHKFDSAATALEQAAALVEGKVTPRLSSLLDTIKDEAKASLAVADPKLASAINKLPQLDLKLVSDSTTTDMYRTIRNNLSSLIPGLTAQDISTMSLGLSHSLSRHKLKFSTDKVDTMIVQAISLLDDLDKELNIYAMRVKEWYGWHFPEMAKIVNDNLAYSRMILKMGMRSNTGNTDLSDILPEEIETAVKNAAEVSMGTEITQNDLENIQALAEQVIGFTEYRAQLASYLSARMLAVAPNLTALLGDLVGARLIAHSGSLMNLAKSPASTIQILGAEKALFRALKTKHDTPKYGLIYHSSLIGQASGKNKGKIARVLGARAALGLRIDALADWSQEGEGKGDQVPDEDRAIFGQNSRDKIERRLAQLEGRQVKPKGVAIANPNDISVKPGKWEVKEAKKYNREADGLDGDEPAKRPQLIEEVTDEPARKKIKTSKLKVPDPLKKPVAIVAEPDSDSSDSDEDSDEDMDDAADEVPVSTSKAPLIQELNGHSKKSKSTENGDDDKSVTLSTVSDETPDSAPSPTPQEQNWQSPIEGNTIVAKKLRKAERHHRKLLIGPERSAEKSRQREKLARKLDRQQRREKKEQQQIQRDDRDASQYAAAALEAGLSITRYKRKLERGEIKVGEDGKATSISKKDIKKAKKEGKHDKKDKDIVPDVITGSNGEVKEKESKKRKRDVAAEDTNGLDEKAKRKAEKKAKKLKKEAKKAAKGVA